MLSSRATSAALAAVFAAVVALPAAASTGSTNGGASVTPQQTSQEDADARKARKADYRRVKATWYGPGFFGNRTACGKVLGRNTHGVAHKRLPCGTKVALRYRGRTVVVPVIDRGPFARGIEYDLTQATARKLGMAQTSRLHAATLR